MNANMNTTMNNITNPRITEPASAPINTDEPKATYHSLNIIQKIRVVSTDTARRFTIGFNLYLAFNLGISGLLKFKKMLAALLQLDYSMAASEMLDSKWAEQVGSRADDLAKQMRTGEWL